MNLKRFTEDGCRGSRAPSSALRRGYLLVECLVYISVLLILLGVTYAAFYRCVASGVAFRRSIDDICRPRQR